MTAGKREQGEGETPTLPRPGVRERQEPLRARYRVQPEAALITDRAVAEGGTGLDPVHGRLRPGSREYGLAWDYGIHGAVGGDHDLPNPGDILCAALAACFDSTTRMIADRMGLHLRRLEVDVTGRVDVRGTLVVDRATRVGFQGMRCRVALDTEAGVSRDDVVRLLAAAEYSCVVLQTLRRGVEVTLEPVSAAAPAPR